jgi:four helix bundle protein
MQGFRTLVVWDRAQRFAAEVFAVTRRQIRDDERPLLRQLQRAAMSIGANIAEGAGADTPRQFARYLNIAIASASEVESHLDLLGRLDSQRMHDVSRLTDEVIALRRMLVALRKRVLEGTQRRSATAPGGTVADRVKPDQLSTEN